MAKSRIGQAYIQVIPVMGDITNQLTKQIVSSVDDAAEEVQQPAEKLGEEIGTGAGEPAAKKLGLALVAGLAALKLGQILQQQIIAGLEQIDINNTLSAALNLSEPEAAKIAEATSNLYKQNYGESYEAVSLAMRGIVGSIKGAREMSSEELEGMATDLINLEKAYGLSSEQISSAVQTMMGAGLASSWDEGVSLILSGYQTMGASGEDWIDTLKEYSDDFVKLGFTGEQALNYVNAGLEKGVMNTDKMADALNEVSIRLQDGSAAEALTSLGFDPELIANQIKQGGPAAQTALMDVLSSLQSSGNLEAWASIVGTMSEDFQIAFQTMDLSSLNNQLAEGVGNLETFDETLNAGASASLGVFQRTIEQTFMDLLIPALELINPPLQAMAAFLSENEEAAGLLAIIVGGALLAGLILATVALFGMAAAGWAAMAPFLPIIGLVLLIVAAVVAIGVAIWQLVENWDVVVAWLTESWEGFIGFLGESAEWIGSVFEGIGKAIGNFFIGIANFLVMLINGLLQGINNISFDMPDWMGGAHIGFNIPLIPEVAYLAKGGTIPARDGGTLGVLGEAGRSEVVMDEGKWNALIDQILAGSVGADAASQEFNITIVQADGESTEELVERLQLWFEMNSLKPAGYGA